MAPSIPLPLLDRPLVDRFGRPVRYLRAAIRAAVLRKPGEHDFPIDHPSPVRRTMSDTGGWPAHPSLPEGQ